MAHTKSNGAPRHPADPRPLAAHVAAAVAKPHGATSQSPGKPSSAGVVARRQDPSPPTARPAPHLREALEKTRAAPHPAAPPPRAVQARLAAPPLPKGAARPACLLPPAPPVAQHVRRAGGRIVQRMEDNYVNERNKEDVEHAQKNFKLISKHVEETDDKGARGLLALYTVKFEALPPKVQDVLLKIKKAKKEQDIYDAGLRDIHENRGGHLPELTLGDQPTQKQLFFKKYAEQMERKDLKKNTAHYAEFHVTESGLGKAFRLLYDYIGKQYYITLSHYNIWKDRSEDRNPFFRVVGIP